MAQNASVELRTGEGGCFYARVSVFRDEDSWGRWILTKRFEATEEHALADEVSSLVCAWLNAGSLGLVSALPVGWSS